MSPNLTERIAYGRSIRDRALCFIEAHGQAAVNEARLAATEPGLPEVDRRFLEAVTERVTRMLRQPPQPALLLHL